MIKRIKCFLIGHKIMQTECLGGHFMESEQKMYSLRCCERCHVFFAHCSLNT